MKKTGLFSVAFFIMLFFIFGLQTTAVCTTFEELVAEYETEKVNKVKAIELKDKLLSQADRDRTDLSLWKSLFSGLPGEKRLSNALLLIEKLFPEGDITRWSEISGMMNPALVPSPLAAVDAVYVSAMELVRMNRESSNWLAGELMRDLERSSRGKMYFINVAPAEYNTVISVLRSRGYRPDYGEWPEARLAGQLPLASPVRGYISMEHALSGKFLFLNAWGQIANNGTYAWDRKRGNIYRIAERGRRKRILIPFP